MSVKVSVVVSVQDPDHVSDECVHTLLGQSLPVDEHEVVFVVAGTSVPAAFDARVATWPHVSVVCAPDALRRTGLAHARGQYVYFVDAEDRLAGEAAARMYDHAVANDADVLVGRLAGRGADVPAPVFKCNRERADVLHHGLLSALGARMLFRREFLEDIGLPVEYREPLADEMFALHALLRSKVVSVLADYTCCHVGERPEPGYEPPALSAGIRRVLDVVDACTEAGLERDRLYAHWLASELLPRLGGDLYHRAPPNQRGWLLAETAALLRECFRAELDEFLPAHLRLRSALARHDRLTDLALLAEAERDAQVCAQLDEVRWDEGVLVLDLSAELVYADGAPLGFRRYGERVALEPPLRIAGIGPELLDVTDAIEHTRLEVFIRNRETREAFALPVMFRVLRHEHEGAVRVWTAGQARLDVGSAAQGHRLDAGVWDVYVTVDCCGRPATTELGAHRSAQAERGCVGTLADYPRRLVAPFWTAEGGLAVAVQPESFARTVALASASAEVARQDGHLFVAMPVPYVPPSGGPPVDLVLRQAGGSRVVSVPAVIEPGVPGRLPGQLVAKVPARLLPSSYGLSPGGWTGALRVDGVETPLECGIEVTLTGRAYIRPAPATRPVRSRAAALAHRAARRVPVVRLLYGAAHSGYRRYVPPPDPPT
ncbi:glycosyltransferase [Bailinhaonella thermotolerans]|uniref:glycosyltransferase n=1 Tax=Bailinhaonella thermotolerans TaxID=1070861 RepID=UPI00192A3BC5|nr:glycosyltransferase [Bailinhaonella thermotolerans]